MAEIVDYPIVFICVGCGKEIRMPSPEGRLGPVFGDPHYRKNGKDYCRACWKTLNK